MKTIPKTVYAVVLSITIYIIVPSVAFAQPLSITETEKWNKVAEFYLEHPAALKDLTEQYRVFKQRIARLGPEIQKLQISLEYKNRQISALQSENLKLKAKLPMAYSSKQEEARVRQGAVDDSGVWFKVQIGAFEKEVLSADLITSEELSIEEDGDLKKVMFGKYRDYASAEKSKNRMQALGFKDAWVVTYQDGLRVSRSELADLPMVAVVDKNP